jgi:hypothetical protein
MPAQTRHVASADNATRGPYQNFQSDSDAEQLFRLQLLRLNAFPFVAALHPGLGYAVETEVEQLSVINSDGQLFRIRRRSGGAATTGRPNWQNVGLYESVPRESVAEATQVPNFSEVVAPPEKGIRIYLAFAHPDAVHIESQSNITAIPSNVISRDITLNANETLTTSYCRVAPSNQHCLAVYTTVGGDGKESRSIVILYDTNWSRFGTIGRNPGSWVQNGRGYLRPFQIDHLFNVDGWDTPIFVTSAFASEPPCSEFRIHTFLLDGRFATIRVPNGVVADDGRRGYCTL